MDKTKQFGVQIYNILYMCTVLYCPKR